MTKGKLREERADLASIPSGHNLPLREVRAGTGGGNLEVVTMEEWCLELQSLVCLQTHALIAFLYSSGQGKCPVYNGLAFLHHSRPSLKDIFTNNVVKTMAPLMSHFPLFPAHSRLAKLTVLR